MFENLFFQLFFFIFVNIYSILGCFLLHFKQQLSFKVYAFWIISTVFGIVYGILMQDFIMLILNLTFLFFDGLGLIRFVKNRKNIKSVSEILSDSKRIIICESVNQLDKLKFSDKNDSIYIVCDGNNEISLRRNLLLYFHKFEKIEKFT